MTLKTRTTSSMEKTSIRRGALCFFYFLPLFGVKLSVVIGRFFEASGDTNSGIDGGVTLGGGKKFEVEEVVDLEESAGDVSFGSECLVIFVVVVSWMLVKVSLCSSNRSWIECVFFASTRFGVGLFQVLW